MSVLSTTPLERPERIDADASEATVVPSVSTPAIPIPVTPAAPEAPPKWFTALDDGRKARIRWVAVADLSLHPACKDLPWSAAAYDRIGASIDRHGLLYPLAAALDGRGVLDGRYRLAWARAHGIERVPVLTIDVDGDDARRWVYEVKDAREHLSEEERAVLAHQYQSVLRASKSTHDSVVASRSLNRRGS